VKGGLPRRVKKMSSRGTSGKSGRGHSKKRKQDGDSGLLPTISPKKAAQMYRATTPPSGTNAFAMSSKLSKRLTRGASAMFSYNSLGHDFSDHHLKSDMTASLRKELLKQKHKKASKSKSKKKKSKDKDKGQSSDSTPRGSSRETEPTTGNSTVDENAEKEYQDNGARQATSDEIVDAAVDDDPEAIVSEEAGIEAEQVEVLDTKEDLDDDIPEEEEPIGDDKDDGDTTDRAPTPDVAELKVADTQSSTSLAAAKTATSKGFKLNFQIDFTKVNFKRMHEEKQRKLQEGYEVIREAVVRCRRPNLVVPMRQGSRRHGRHADRDGIDSAAFRGECPSPS